MMLLSLTLLFAGPPAMAEAVAQALRATAPTPYAAAHAEVKSGSTAFAYVGVGEQHHALVKALAAGDSSRNAVPVLLRPCVEFPSPGVWLMFRDAGGVVRALPQTMQAVSQPQVQATPVGPGITIAPVTTPAPGGGPIGIKFRDTLAGAKAEAAGGGRPVAVVVTGEACPPCRRMEAETYNAAPVVEALNGEFLPVKLVAEQATLEVAALGVNQWPTTVILDGETGKELRRVTGYCGPVEYLAAIRGDPAPRGGRRPVQNLAKAAGWLLRGKEWGVSQSIWPLVVAGMGAAFGYGCSTVLACIHGRGRRLGVALLLCVPFATLLAMTCKPHPLAKAAASADDAERINRAQAKFGALIVQELEIGRRQ